MAWRAFSFRWAGLSLVWTMRDSSTWGPMGITGSMEVMGSWNTTAMSFPRRARTVSREALSRSIPSKKIWPVSSVLALLSSPARAMAVTVLPLPDSPTRPRISPRAMFREMPFTASFPGGALRKWTCRS